MTPRYLKLAAPLALVAILGAACGDDDESPAASGDPATTETTATEEEGGEAMGSAAGVETPAAELRAGLTSLLQEHVYLAGAAISQAVADGGDMAAPATTSAVETLDANSVALSEAVASVYGEDAGAQFLELWRKHIGFFVDYTL